MIWNTYIYNFILNLTHLINDTPEPENDSKYHDPEGGNYDDANYDQKKEGFKFDQFSSPQLRKPEKIK